MEKKNNLKKELEQNDFIENVVEKANGLIIDLKNWKYYKDLMLILGNYNVIYFKENKLTLEDLFIKLA